MTVNRCSWCLKSKLYQDYHDNEWGRPLHDESKLFEFLILETMQSGLSFITILNRRENYRQAFANFDPKLIAKFDADKVEELMLNSGIIRNRKKIEATINNAQKFLVLQQTQTFDSYIWSFTNGETIKNHWHNLTDMQSTSPLSDIISKDLKNRGFKFIGSTTIYAYLQAIGIINDHLTDCFLY